MIEIAEIVEAVRKNAIAAGADAAVHMVAVAGREMAGRKMVVRRPNL
jgi:hypothetical protein